MTSSQTYATVSRRALDLEDYIDVARRHAAWICGPLFIGIVISICVAFFLRNSYDSKAVLQIVPAQISQNLVQATVNQELNERVSQMQSVILSRTNLGSLISDPKLNLYKDELATRSLEDVIDGMRKDIVISLMNTSAARNGGSTFAIQFTYENRLKAQATVQALVTKFMDENTTSQTTQQTLLKDYFGDELNINKANMEKRGEELTRFKTENQGALPEQGPINMAQLSSLQTQQTTINDQLNRIVQDRVQLETHLSALNQQLALANSMAQQDSTYLPSSPAARQNEELVMLNKAIASGEGQLQQYLQTYKETYPDIRDLKNRLGLLKKQRDDLLVQQEKQQAAEAAKPKEESKKPMNFQMAQNLTALRSEIERAKSLLALNDAEKTYRLKELEGVNKKIDSYQSKLAATSGVEAKYMDLKRDYDNAVLLYQETLKKKEITAQSGELISRKATETLNVLDPASYPTKQSKPDRLKIIGIGVALSLIVGLAFAGVQEARDSSLKNLKDVRAYTNLPVLSSIPLLENTLLVKRKKRITYLVWSAAVILGVMAVATALFYYYTVTANT